MEYDEYRDEQIQLQLSWRKTQNISKENGSQNGKFRDWIIPKVEWEKTIWIELQEKLKNYLINEHVQHHIGVHNLLSSWILCSNLYFGVYFNENFKELFRQFLEIKLETSIEKIKEIYLEFALEGNLNPKNLLGEPNGKRGSGQTSPDVAVCYSTDDKDNLVLIECKYTEHSFYNCSGRKIETNSGFSPNPNPERCIIKETIMDFTNNCHQITWGRKYWDYLNISEYGKNILKKCPASAGGYQLVRQQALAEGIQKYGQFNKVFSCVAYDGRNEHLMESMSSVGISSIKNEFKKLFDLKSDFIVWEHQEWVNYVKNNGKNNFEKEWVKYINERYAL